MALLILEDPHYPPKKITVAKRDSKPTRAQSPLTTDPRMKEQRWEMRLGLFDTIVLALIVTDSLYLSAKNIKEDERGEEDYYKQLRAITFEEDGKYYLMLDRKIGVNFRTISHEALHIATRVLNQVGVPISFDNDEILAYTQDWIIGETLSRLREKKIRVAPFRYVSKCAPMAIVTKL